MTFYKDCFGGDLVSEVVKDSPMKSQAPEKIQNNILHSNLVSDNISILASDIVEQNGLQAGNNVSLALICTTEQEIENYFQKLSHDGIVKYPIHNFYGGKIGGVVDQFGIHWFLKL